MKWYKGSLVLLLIVVLVTVFAGPVMAMSSKPAQQPDKCFTASWECSSLAYQAAVNEFKYYDPEKIQPWTATTGQKGGWDIPIQSPEFKAYEKQVREQCYRDRGCESLIV